MLADRELRECLADQWLLRDAAIVAHHGGMNSLTWFVEKDGKRWVAKAVEPASTKQFRAGLVVASIVEDSGISAGAPVPTVDGRFVASVGGYPLALLRWVPGTPLTGLDADEQSLIGTTLARVHHALASATVEEGEAFHWIDPTAEHLAIRPWIRDEVTAAIDALEGLVLSQGLLHTDPAPGAFRLSAGACGLIDWSTAMAGPLLYDLASAVMYVGGTERAHPLLDAYLATGALSSDEVQRGLATMVRFRWAVQADYFARRIVARDLTGISGEEENEKGLEDARRGFGEGLL